ncbi:MAG TPA: Smr/MutS family protein [Blastocatellia bacterium]|nr:Smr/MutS family protein [Blastocatellia bacterium]
MKLLERLRRALSDRESEPEPEDPLGEDEDPFAGPVVIEIRDVIDLHSIPPRQVKAVVEEYLNEARQRGFRHVRIIHGKGIGTQREMVRAILARTPFVVSWSDAPPEAGGWGATVAELAPPE